MRKWLIGLLIIIGFINGLSNTHAYGAANSNKIPQTLTGKRIILVSIPGLSFQEVEMIQSLSSWASLWKNGAMAAMNVRTPRTGVEDIYASIGAGAPALAKIRDQGFVIDEQIGNHTAKQLHERYVGHKEERAGNIVVFTIADLLLLNERQHQSAIPGLLGERLQEAGVKRYVFGNRDLTIGENRIKALSLYFRHAPLLLVDAHGLIDDGQIGSALLQADPLRPFGLRTDYERLLQIIDNVDIQDVHNVQDDDRLPNREHVPNTPEAEMWIQIGNEHMIDDEFVDDEQIEPKASHIENVHHELNEQTTLKLNNVNDVNDMENVTEPQMAEQVILIELGDLDRLYAEKDLYGSDQFERIKKEILNEMGIFLHTLRQRASSDTLFVFSPIVHSKARNDKSLLTPFLAFDSRIPPGWLSSDTTRRAGLISYVDVAPTILHYFGLQVPAEMRGSPLHMEIANKTAEELLVNVHKMENIYRLRPKFSYPYVTIQVLILVAGLAYIFFRLRTGWSVLRVALYSVIFAPILLLIMGKVSGWPAVHIVSFFCITVLVASWCFSRFRDMIALFAVGAITALFILIDGWFGAEAMKGSILGYDPLIGARYYGIGNEFMGVLIGAVILAVSVWQQRNDRGRYVRWGVSLAVFIPVLIFMASPVWGANAGGALTAAAAFASYAWLSEQTIRGWENFRLIKLLLTVSISLLIGFGCLWLLNVLLFSSEESHIGKAFAHLMSGDYALIGAIVWRKIAMNMHLLGVSSWGKLFLAGLLVIVAVMMIRRRRKYWKWPSQYPLLVSGYSANLIGALIAFLTNDSGIVAAATMILYAAVPILLIGYSNVSHSE